ncbi:MAG TPA: ABC transporter permease [Gaiellaceae bacterium]|nr:ABC transporter permease [Gaiellaceae bacterium]
MSEATTAYDMAAEVHVTSGQPERRSWHLSRVRALPPGVLIGGGIVSILVIVAIAAPLIAPDDPQAGSLLTRLQGVGTSGHLLGTDGQGRDVLSRLIWGARPSLIAGIVPVAIAGVIGTALGAIAGFGGSRLRTLLMRSLDVLYAFPAILLAIAIGATLGPGLTNVIVSLSVILIPPIARIAESEALRIRSLDFMDAARTSGAGWIRIGLRQVLPNIAPPVIVYCTALVGLAIVYAAGLSFLGLGIVPPQPDWGGTLNDLRNNLFTQPWLSLVPAAAIFIASAAFNILGDGLRELLDVRADRAK